MASKIDFDNLNVVGVNEDIENAIQSEISTYFSEMELEEYEIDERIALGIDLEKNFRNLFILISAIAITGNTIEEKQATLEADKEYLYDKAYWGYADTLINNGFYDTEYFDIGDGYVAKYIKQQSQNIVDSSILYQADSYYMSVGRSILCGENEANAVANYEREQKAILKGYTKKTWITKRDKRVRRSHIIADGETVGIFDAFEIGKYQMMFPLDASLGAEAEEIVRCRCVCKYSK